MPFQVPIDVPQFVDRAQEFREISARFKQVGSRNIYCLTGMGGIGKTSLAIRLAYLMRDHFTDGVLWANVAASTPLDILDNWARAFGYDISSIQGVSNKSATLRSELVNRNILIILDDAATAEQVRPLLLGGLKNVVLVTTRNRNLPIAIDGKKLEVPVLDAADCLQLLIKIVGEDRISNEPEPAQEICELLGFLPLAVKIAGRRLASRPRWQLAELAARLRNEKPLEPVLRGWGPAWPASAGRICRGLCPLKIWPI